MQTLSQLLDLTEKTAIVTGGSRGIGLGISQRLLEAGANVVIASISESELSEAREILQSYQSQTEFIKTDVASEKDVQELINQTVSKFGTIDILVNNAGIFPSTPVLEMTSEHFQKVIDINLKGVFLCSKYAAEVMVSKKHGGKIINITSIDALHPSSVGLAHYDASKHGVWGFTKNLALELAPHKIWVNAIAPGAIATPGVAEMQSNTDSTVDMNATLEGFLQNVPMKRMGNPDDIAKATLFLASEMSSYITGEQIVVDGGMLLT